MIERKYHPQVKKDLKNIDKDTANEIKEIHLNNISNNPYIYKKLKGSLKDFYSYHFRKNGVEYRIAYYIEYDKIIVILMVASRENFYEKLLNRLK